MKKLLVVFLMMISFCAKSQNDTLKFLEVSKTFNKKRLAGVAVAETVGYGASLVMLNELWYKYYPRSKFHTFNDNSEWMQMDKFGHSMTSYYVGYFGYNTLRWTGLEEKKCIWYGATLGSFYLLIMEVLDGFAADWGFSVGDIAANTAGTALFIGQQLRWEEQRIKMKVSAHLTETALLRPNIFGHNTTERLLKDYNGQTYWLSGNISSFLNKETKFPKWINVAVGYGAEDMYTGSPNQVYYANNTVYSPDARYRQYYLSLDVDFTKIPTKSKLLKTTFGLLNMVKMPFPALEFSKNGIKGKGFYF